MLVLVLALLYIRRRRARAAEARMPQRQIPFVVNPTWVLASPTSATSGSHLSLPDRARPRTVPVVAPQISLPNLGTQYRTRVFTRPRASTVGEGSVVAGASMETVDSRDRAKSDSALTSTGGTGSDSAVWRPRIDILAARQQRAEGRQPQSF